MTRRLYILLPGIRTDPADWRNWAPRMATEINLRCPRAKAEEFRYFACAITPKGKQDERVRYVVNLATRAAEAGYQVVIGAHSNGAIIATKALEVSPAIYEAVHLFAPACESSMERNGLNQALRAGIVRQCHIYTGTRDGVLRWIAPAGAWLGYGQLGWTGPQDLLPSVAGRVTVLGGPHDHNSWFDQAHFENTFRSLTCAEEEVLSPL